ncbi:MAG: acetyl-CoA acetyltransferase [Betaproteobacteria bacterium]|nr:acetyl-CoA acetyltransferase [Betaproteobacteria bacterium]
MWNLRDRYAIGGIGFTRFSKASGVTVLELATEACLKACEDAGVNPDEVDGLISFNFGDSVPGMAVATAMGLPDPQYVVDFDSGGNAANLITLAATAAIEAGLAKNVLCFRAMNGRSGFRLGGSRDLSAYNVTQYTAPFGWITYPQAMAMWCRAHMVKYGTTKEQLGSVAVSFRENAVLNERAMIRTPLTIDEYLGARKIVDPFGLYDICLESDGACAALVTSAERARDMRHRPVYIMGGAYGGGIHQGEDLFDAIRWPDLSENFSKYIAGDLWKSAGIGPEDVDVAEIYDCFTYTVIMVLEGLGFCKPGEAGAFAQGGGLRRTGPLPTNTHGGLLSEAYIHGFNHVIEAVEQLRGHSGARQIEGARIALTTAGAMTCGSAMILRN